MLTRSLRYLKSYIWSEPHEKDNDDLTRNDDLIVDDLPTREIIRDYAGFIFTHENRPRIFAASLLTFLGTALNFLSPALLGKVIQALAQEENVLLAGIEVSDTTLMICLVASYSFQQLVPTVRDQVLVPVSENSTKALITAIVDNQLQNKNLHYHNSTDESEKIYLLQKGFSVSGISTPLLTKVTPALLEIMIALVLMTNEYGLPVSVSVSTMIAVSVAYTAATAKYIVGAKENQMNRSREAWQAIFSSITRYKSIHDFNQSDLTMQKLEANLQMSTAADIDSRNVLARISMGNIAIPRFSMLAAAMYLGSRFQSRQMAVPEFVALFGYLNQLSNMLPLVGEAMGQVMASSPDLRFIFTELSKPSQVIDRHPDTPLQVNGPSSIKFDNVSFTYPPSKKSPHKHKVIFDRLCFSIDAGQTVALVSPSGAGKSTIFQLLYGYFQPTSGNIFINNQNISEISLSSLRKNIRLVGQTANLFNGTVRENITFGSADNQPITDEQIYELAHSLNLSSFIHSLEKKLDTSVGERGGELSGGQQQKVAILRSYIKHCNIQLLDEITSSLDAASAQSILSGINNKSVDSTTIIITHKLSEVVNADKIIVLREGRVESQGTHEQLLVTSPLYLQLWENQNSSKNEVGATPATIQNRNF